MKTSRPNRYRPAQNMSFLLALGVLAAVPVGFSETALLFSVADSEIHRLSEPDGNYGAGSSVVSGRLNNGETRRALLRFDLSSIPAGATVDSASLRLQVTKVPTQPANSTFDLRRILKPWSETGVTWNNRLSSGTPWEIGGLSGPGDTAATASASVPVADTGAYTFTSTPGLVSDLQFWVNEANTNFGWLLISQDEVTPKTARHFGAREDVGNRPLLTVNYTPGISAPTNILLTNIVHAANEFRFSFLAESNRVYTVESQGSLSPANWATVLTFPSTNIALTRTVTNTISSSNQYFRVRTP